jgi:hypothetical protein
MIFSGESLQLIGLWSDVLKYAVELCMEPRDSKSSTTPIRIELTWVELCADTATLCFERRLGGDGMPEVVCRNEHAVSRTDVETARVSEVWKVPIKRKIRQLVACDWITNGFVIPGPRYGSPG